MDEKLEYTEPLKGTLAEAVHAKEGDELGVPFSPLSQIWQVNPGAEAVPNNSIKQK
ncbi:hypothetical protein BRE01_26590 [Brevibacillus reuszeri]|uniref:Uncharacterized protein n=1 Tax=Brevibacillus reuszeri TaxID=54915 RepID=A0ABQ0TM95_9BACL|nr:hypothetical protein [Brevibacillus reuszeri]MED1858051.1 hypothetical protein [Brevibacillus reuszeri]GED68957.1 hypothetical protein BRE01_26590 [Brevibacillus reuszeri]